MLFDKVFMLTICKRWKKRIEERQGDRADLEERLKKYTILTPEQKNALEQFRTDIKRRLSPNVPFEEKRKLMEILRIEVIYDDDTGNIAVNGLMGSIPLTSKSGSGGSQTPRL